jgi:cysteinyl-tRNA synthetase
MKELGESIDIHLGGEDLRMIHHQNEIAQSECATGKKFTHYWVHGAFLLVDGGRMGKSLGNAYTIFDIEDKKFNPLALRYLYLTAHYRSKLNFTWESLQNAQNALKKVYDMAGSLEEKEGAVVDSTFLNKFSDALNNDLNMPEALAVMWEMLQSDIPEYSKIVTLLRFDEVLGLDIENYIGYDIPQKVLDLVRMREAYRKSGIWDKADGLRREISELGYVLEDKGDTCRVKRKINFN